MKKMPLVATMANWLCLAIGLSIFTLTLFGKSEFGHGLGDLIYLVVLGLFVVAHVILNLSILKPRKASKNWMIGLVFLTVYGYFAFKISYGRGPENSWNGELWTQSCQTPLPSFAKFRTNPLT